MKELDWIILTSWSAPPRTPQLQQAGLHCSLLSLYMCACETMVSPSHLQVDTASPTWMLIIFLIGFLDLVTSSRDGKTTSLCSSFNAAMLFSDFACSVCVVLLASIHFHTVEIGAGLEPVWPLTPSHPLVVHFHHYPSSHPHTLCTHLSRLLVLICPANTFETSTSQTLIETL